MQSYMQRLERAVGEPIAGTSASASAPVEIEMDPLLADIVLSMKAGGTAPLRLPPPRSAKKQRPAPEVGSDCNPAATASVAMRMHQTYNWAATDVIILCRLRFCHPLLLLFNRI